MKEVKFLVVFLLVLPLFLNACAVVGEPPIPPAGQIVPLQTGTVLNGISKAVLDKPDTFRYMKDQMVVLGFYVKNMPAFVCFNSAGLTCSQQILELVSANKGNGVNPTTMRDLRDFLQANGWQSVSGNQLPDCIKILAGATMSYVISVSKNFVTVLIVPAGVLTPDFLEELRTVKG